MSRWQGDRLDGIYVWPGLLQAVTPGDLFIVRRSPSDFRGAGEDLHVCLWSSPYTGEDDEQCCWVGTIRLGADPKFDELWYRRAHPVWFPCPR